MARYRFDEYTLDAAALLLARGDSVVDVPRRVFDCLALLLAERQRAVGRDELIRRLWGRDNVSDNQLAQTVAAARRLIDDDGVSQRRIRTVPGFGYHWIGPVDQLADAAIPDSVVVPPLASITDSSIDAEIAAPPSQRRRLPAPTPAGWLLLGVATLLVTFALQRLALAPPPSQAASEAAPIQVADPLHRIRAAIRSHAFDSAREWLAQLPAPSADSAEARHLEIELDLASGRLKSAAARIAMQLAQPDLSAQPVVHARLLLQRVTLRRRLGEPGWQQDAESAVQLLGADAPPRELAHALFSRGVSHALAGREDAAGQDFVASRARYLEAGDVLGAADAAGNLARLWVRAGRLAEALEQLQASADTYARNDAPGSLLNALTSIASIQATMLRWPAALASSDRARSVYPLIADASRRQNFLRVRALVLTGLGRLREAATLLVEAEEEGRRGDLTAENRAMVGTFAAQWALAAGDFQRAQREAQQAFTAHAERLTSGAAGMRLDARDQALLLFVQARQQALAEDSSPLEPEAAALGILEMPQTNYARIARGRWLFQQGQWDAAEQSLQEALAEAVDLNRLARILTASEALVDLLLARGRPVAARTVVRQLLAFDPAMLQDDYETALLRLRVALALNHATEIAVSGQLALTLSGERIWPRPLIAAAWHHTLDRLAGRAQPLERDHAPRTSP